jgi:uncharacterized protein (TIGR03437 family)
MRVHRVLGFLLFGGSVWAQQFVISTFAGGAPPATPLTATSASVGDPTRMAADAAGNVYFGSLDSVFKVDTNGNLTRFAGNGRAGNSGDGGPATAAQLSFPMGIAIDGSGNVFVADRDASVVRKIATNGIITTAAGTGKPGYTGDGGPAASAQLNGPFGLAMDDAGNLYIADTGNQVVRRVSMDGTISTVAGTGTAGYAGDGGAARSAQLNGPEGVAVDGAGNLYIADTFNGRIRRVATDGTITTAAGVGSTGIFSGDGGPPASAGISLPPDVAADRAGNLYIADFGNSRIRLVSNGEITTVVGSSSGAPMTDGELAINVRLDGPTGVGIDRAGAIYFVQAGIGSGSGLAKGDYKVWKVSADGVLTTLAGNGVPSYSGDGGAATAAQLNGPAGVAVASSGVVYIADTQNQRVRAVAANGTISTAAGTGTAGFNGEIGLPRTAQLNLPQGVAVDGQGNWYVADTANNRIRKVQPGGNLLTIAGNGNASYFGDGGPATKASVNQPEGVAVDAAGNVYIADTLDNAVRKVTPDGTISTLAGTGTPGYSGDGGPAKQARMKLPRAVTVDAGGNVYVADTGNNQIRRIDAQGTITTVDTEGALNDPRGVAVDRAGNLYVADTGNRRVRRVSAGVPLTTVAGNGSCCYSGDGGLAVDAQLNQPWGVAVDASGNIFVADAGNSAVRMLSPVSATITVSAITNAASNLAGPVAPGEVITMYGSGLAGAQTALLNGVTTPLLYATPGQAGAVVPALLSGSSVQVAIQGLAGASSPVTVPVVATTPGIFAADGSGRGQAAALNQDGTRNAPGAPAAAGSLLTLFATGEGLSGPSSFHVTIGGLNAEMRAAQPAPGQPGVLQVTVVVPNGLSGAAPVVLFTGGVASQSGVTVTVR